MAKIRNVTLWGTGWNKLLHVPLEDVEIDVERKEKVGEVFEVEGVTFQVTELHRGYISCCTLLETKLLGSVPPASVARFLEGRGRSITQSYLWGSWCFYINSFSKVAPLAELQELREKLGHEPTSEDLDRLLMEDVRKRWHDKK